MIDSLLTLVIRLYLVLFFYLIPLAIWSQDHLSLADSLYEIENFNSAEDSYRSALKKAVPEAKAPIGLKIYNLLIDQGKFDTAGKFLDSLVLSIKHISPDSTLALAIHKSGVAYYYDYDEDKAIKRWMEAIEMRKQLYSNGHIDIVKGNRNIGSALMEIEKYKQAQEYLINSIREHLKTEKVDSILLGRTYMDLAFVNCKNQDIESASTNLFLAQKLIHQHFQDDPYELPILYDVEYEYHIQKGDYFKAINTQEEKIKLISSIVDQEPDDQILIALGNSNIAYCYSAIDDLERALQYYKVAIEQLEKLDDLAHQELFKVYLNIADLYLDLNNLEFSEKYLLQADGLKNDVNNKNDLLVLLANKSELKLKQGEILESKILLDSLEDQLALDSIDLDLLLEINYLRADLLIESYAHTDNVKELKQAASIYNTNVDLINDLIFDFQRDNSKIHLNNRLIQSFSKGIRLFIKLYELESDEEYLKNALTLSEQSRAVALGSVLSDYRLKKILEVPKSLLKKEKEYKNELVLLSSDQSILENEKRISKLSIELQTISTQLLEDYPTLSSLRRVTANIDTYFNDLSDYTVIEYFKSDSSLFTFIINNGKITLYETEAEHLDFEINQFRKLINESFQDYLNEDYIKLKKTNDSLNQISTSLFNKLIPFSNQGRLKENLLIIPHGQLNFIPFDALVDNNGNYLIESFKVVYAPSLRTHQEMTKSKVSPTKNLLTVAPVFHFESENDSHGNENFLKPLYFNISEVDKIKEICGRAKSLVRNDATYESFISIVEDYRIIHLATHAFANSTSGNDSFIALTPHKDPNQKSKLYNHDLYQMNLNSEMVVLSACESGLGEYKSGEGVISLARGFSYAGSKSVVTSLWNVNDKKSMELMHQFYSNLSTGLNKSDALRNAKLEFVNSNSENAQPFLWAAYIPIGDMTSITQLNSSWYKLATFSVLIISILLIRYFVIKYQSYL